MRQQPNHIVAGVEDQRPNCSTIRCGIVKQRGGGFDVRVELSPDEIGYPLGAGKIQIFLRTKVIGNGSDVLPSLGRNIAGRGMESVFAKLRQR